MCMKLRRAPSSHAQNQYLVLIWFLCGSHWQAQAMLGVGTLTCVSLPFFIYNLRYDDHGAPTVCWTLYVWVVLLTSSLKDYMGLQIQPMWCPMDSSDHGCLQPLIHGSKDGSPNPIANKFEIHQSLGHLQNQSFEVQETFCLDYPSNSHLNWGTVPPVKVSVKPGWSFFWLKGLKGVWLRGTTHIILSCKCKAYC